MLTILNVALMNLLLSSDNILIISLVGKTVDKSKRFTVLMFSLLVSVILQLGILFVIAFLFQFSFLQSVFGVLMCYMAYHLLSQHITKEEKIRHQSVSSAVGKIVVGNLMMSFENDAALIPISNGNVWMAWIGVLATLPLIFLGSHSIFWLLEKYHVIVYIGSVILFKIGMDLVFTYAYINTFAALGSWFLTGLFALFVVYKYAKARSAA
ncbi:hypothetical protein LSG31_00020 [Fodinisporobacter ferrooxydans]|uniref:Uncharacterized protein n=1 Tax=Fodinisporobacter ferrooxydans TaxID=2901836 RepID=A0ABY4CJL6_9BACL|nr:hypothetical protein LSG31_00020 [Alicyclobacillaceae bacterium MYW30-H2]